MALPEREDGEFRLLSLANNDRRKFAIQMGYGMDKALQEAFERGIDEQWFTLVDVSPIHAAPDGRVMRIFRLTDSGFQHFARLKQWMEKGVPWA